MLAEEGMAAVDHLDILKKGTRLHAKYHDGRFYPAEVVAISRAKKWSKTPVKVQFVGHESEGGEWLAVSSLRSKLLREARSASLLDSCKSPATGAVPAAPPSTANGNPRQLRRLESAQLHEHEERRALNAAASFNSLDMPEVSFGDRDEWQRYKDLLNMVKEAEATVGENHGELETETDRAVANYKKMTAMMVSVMKRHQKRPKMEAFVEETFVNPSLRGAVFVGHVATDLDSIAGAMGAAALFGGTACKSEEELNGEIRYALKEVAKLEEPPLFDDTPGAGKPDERGDFSKVCLVDHNEEKQMVASLRNDPLRRKRIIGLIDHHALSDSFSSDAPLLIDVRPWGSMSSIVAHMYMRSNAVLSPGIARLLMCAILSDTLNLQSVTTTDADRFAVALLARIGGVEDPDQVARLMFRAKTSWIVNLGPYSMCRGDQKDFSADGWKYGIAVLEVTDTKPVLAVAQNLIVELRTLKIEKGSGTLANELDFAFLFVVDIVKQRSVLLVCGGREYALARAAFPGCKFSKAHDNVVAPGKTISADQTLCDVGPLVSRKAQFVPAFSTVLNGGFSCHKERVSSSTYKETPDDEALRAVFSTGSMHVVVTDDQNYTRTPVAAKAAAEAVFGV
eukprot:TRINITY_DN10923_c0_g1_i2.p1 TRINITY_DN10923_c0_g1~~TRINITY_DN10923_c0_g1_i2.p1  ORF type:complete len:623 (+),score=145.78 TRINITY_DN10923_c0_g1_i2:81-1949(+)